MQLRLSWHDPNHYFLKHAFNAARRLKTGSCSEAPG